MNLKYFFSIFVLFLGSVVWATGQEGNGGFGLKCGNKVEILELYEAREVHRFNVDLGPANLSVDEKIKIILQRMARWMPAQATGYQKLADEFFKQHGEILGSRVLIVANKKSLEEGKQPPLDIGNTIFPKNCDWVAMARNYGAENSPTRRPRAFLYSDSYGLAENDSKAILWLHELFLMFGRRGAKPQDVRFVLAHLISREFDSLTFEQWQNIATLALETEYIGVFYKVEFLTDFYPDGRPMRMSGRNWPTDQYEKWPLKLLLPGTNLLYLPFFWRGDADFNKDGQVRRGIIYGLEGTSEKNANGYDFEVALTPAVSLKANLPKSKEHGRESISYWNRVGLRFELDGNNQIIQLAEGGEGSEVALSLPERAPLRVDRASWDEKQNSILFMALGRDNINQIIGFPFDLGHYYSTVNLELRGTADRQGRILKINFVDFTISRPVHKDFSFRILTEWSAVSNTRFKSAPTEIWVSGTAAQYGWSVNHLEMKDVSLMTQVGSKNFCIEFKNSLPNLNVRFRSGQVVPLAVGQTYTITMDSEIIPLTMGCVF